VTSQPPIFTIGHSTRSIPDFVQLLRAGPADLVVDVRTVPRSRHNPQYNEDALPDELAAFQVAYIRIAGLGGLRGKSRDIPASVNGYWDNQSFRNYADYALSDEFGKALDQLLDLSVERRVAIMCAEAVWWRCHRRIIADYLIARGRDVRHLLDDERVEQARLTPGAKPADGKVRYPAAQGLLGL
jgi:uncharacterized protein (DUF488 family)